MSLKNTYDVIASSWSKLKTKPFGFVVDFINGKKGVFFVAGCGAGRHSSLVNPVVGVDFSFNMITLARNKDVNGDYLVADVRALPFKDEVFDYSICVAVLHHLPPSDLIGALLELKRLTKNECLISVWLDDSLRGEHFVKWGSDSRYYYFYETNEFLSFVKKVFKSVRVVPDSNNIVLVVS